MQETALWCSPPTSHAGVEWFAWKVEKNRTRIRRFQGISARRFAKNKGNARQTPAKGSAAFGSCVTTEAEKRDINKCIETGKPQPERYRFLLFEDKREVELVWNGKSRDVCTAILPFQTLEHIDEPRSVGVSPTSPSFQPDLIDMSGRQTKGWANKLIGGDNKLILSSLKSSTLLRQIEDAGGLKVCQWGFRCEFDPSSAGEIPSAFSVRLRHRRGCQPESRFRG